MKKYDETIDDMLERIQIENDLKSYKEYAEQMQREDDYNDHDDDYYR